MAVKKKAAKKKTVKKKAAKKKAVPKKKAAKKKAAPKKKTAKKKTAKKKAVKKKAAPKKKAAKKKTAVKKKTVKKKAAPKKTAATKKKAAPGRVAALKKAAAKTSATGKAEAAEEQVTTRKKTRRKPLNKREIALKRLLVENKEAILKEAQTEIAKYIKGENRQLVETALDDGDWSVVDLSEDISFRQLGTHRQNLRKIDEALRKIDEGSYGVCEDCGDDINSERLKILPFAIYCRDCQEKREQLEAAERWEGAHYST